MAEKFMGLQVGGPLKLSDKAQRFLREHPREAAISVSAALEAAARLAESVTVEPSMQDDAVPEDIRRFVVRLPAGADMLTATQAADRLGVSRTTIYDWVDSGRLIGWRGTKQGLIIPAEQIAGPGKVLDGIEDVLKIIDNPELAWAFLSQTWPFADDVARPVDKLKAGQVGAVLAAAPSFGNSVT
jgi:excisionase family DNA binding protein